MRYMQINAGGPHSGGGGGYSPGTGPCYDMRQPSGTPEEEAIQVMGLDGTFVTELGDVSGGDITLYNVCIGAGVTRCGGGLYDSTLQDANTITPDAFQLDGTVAALLPGSEAGAFLFQGWTADIKAFPSKDFSINDGPVWDAFDAALSNYCTGDGWRGDTTAVNAGKLIRRPGWAECPSTSAARAASEAASWLGMIYASRDASAYPTLVFLGTLPQTTDPLADAAYACPHVQNVKTATLESGCWGDRMMNTRGGWWLYYKDGVTLPFYYGGKYGSTYLMGNPMSPYSGLFSSSTYTKSRILGAGYRKTAVTTHSGYRDTEYPDGRIIGKACGYVLSPINREDWLGLMNEGRLARVEPGGTRQTVTEVLEWATV